MSDIIDEVGEYLGDGSEIELPPQVKGKLEYHSTPKEPNSEIDKIIGILYSTGYFDASTAERYEEVRLVAGKLQSEVEAAIDRVLEQDLDWQIDIMTIHFLPDHIKAKLKAKSNGVKTLKFGGKDDTETTYKIDADTWNPDKPEVIYPEQQSNRSDT